MVLMLSEEGGLGGGAPYKDIKRKDESQDRRPPRCDLREVLPLHPCTQWPAVRAMHAAGRLDDLAKRGVFALCVCSEA